MSTDTIAPARSDAVIAETAVPPPDRHAGRAHLHPAGAMLAEPVTRAAFAGSRWTLIVRNVLRQRSRNLMLGALILFASLAIAYFSQFLEGVARNFSQNLIALASGEVYVSSEVTRAADRSIFDRDYRYFRLPDGLRARAQALPGFVSVAERLEFDAKVVTELDSIPFRVMAFDKAAEPRVAANFTFTDGRMFAPGEYGIVLPADFARRHGVRVGDRVRLLAKAVNNKVNLIDYTVTGLFATQSLSAWFDTYAYLDLAVARVLVDDAAALTRLNINLADDADPAGADAANAAAVLTNWLKQHPVAGNPPLDASDWRTGTAMFAELTAAMQLSYAIVIGIVVVMMGASLAFSTMMNILERTKEIATLGALGATPKTIRRMLVAENLLLAAVAALAGIAVAAAASLITARTGIPITNKELAGFLGSSHFHPAFQAGGYLAGFLMPVAVAFAASLLFARRAARLPIAEAIADR